MGSGSMFVVTMHAFTTLIPYTPLHLVRSKRQKIRKKSRDFEKLHRPITEDILWISFCRYALQIQGFLRTYTGQSQKIYCGYRSVGTPCKSRVFENLHRPITEDILWILFCRYALQSQSIPEAPMGTGQRKYVKYEDDLLFRIVALFFQKKTVRQIAGELGLNRESVYPLLARARDRGFVQLVPPVEEAKAEAVATKFRCPPGSIRVVNVGDKRFGKHVAASAAELVLGVIEEVGQAKGKDRPVGLGLGPGRVTLDLSRCLNELLQSNPGATKLKLFAISAGGPAESPQYAPTSFFNLFPEDRVVGQVGLFAETLVPAQDFKDIKRRPGVSEAFDARDEIDVVVTAMGDIDDEHDLLTGLSDVLQES